MTFTVTNGLEGGTNGATITAANSGGASGTAFSSVGIVTGSSLTYDNTIAAHGAMAAKLVVGSTAGSVYIQWNETITGTQAWFRMYAYFTANPTSSHRLISVSPSTNNCAFASVSTAGVIGMYDTNGSNIFNLATALPLNSWFRLEGFVIQSPTAGQVELKIYTLGSVDSTTPTESKTSASTFNTGSAIPARFLVGDSGASVSNQIAWWFDDIGFSDQGYLGPAVTRAPANLGGTFTDTNAYGGTAVFGSPVYSGSATETNAYGGTATETNKYGGTATYASPIFGGTQTDANQFGGTFTDSNQYGGTQTGFTMQAQNISLNEFNDEIVNLTVTQNGSAFNLTGYTLKAYFKTNKGVSDTDPSTLTLSSTGGSPALVVTNATQGLVTMTIPNSDLGATASYGFWRLDVINASSQQNTVMYGTVTINQL